MLVYWHRSLVNSYSHCSIRKLLIKFLFISHLVVLIELNIWDSIGWKKIRGLSIDSLGPLVVEIRSRGKA